MTFLSAQAKFYSELKQKSEKTIVNNIRRAEVVRKTYSKIKINIAPQKRTNLHRIIVLQDNTPDIILTESNAIYDAILNENKRIMQSSGNTPPASAAMQEFIGNCGDGPGVELILAGENLPLEIEQQEFLHLLLQEMKTLETDDHPFPLISDEITFDEFKDVFLATRESTVSSPSGLHIGHYQVAAYFPEIGKVLATMMTLPFQYAFAPERWCNSIHLMLEKCQGRPLLNKLRIIQLFEADFNASLKIKISRQLMRTAEEQQLFGKDMHGGLKGKSMHDALMTQQLTYNISQQNKTP